MDKIPNELLSSIFIYLPIVQKQECMLVCQHWRDVIKNQSLFHTVTLPFKPGFIEKFITLMEKNPHLNRQVEELFIHRIFDKRRFFHLFPNLKIVRYSEKSLPRYNNFRILETSVKLLIDSLRNTSIERSSHRLYCLKDFLKYPITIKQLASGYCSHFTRLTLLGKPDRMVSSIFSLLTKAPMIKYLKLEKIHLTITDCHLIDDSLPSLEVFILKDCLFIESSVPARVVPNSKLYILALKSIRFSNSYPGFDLNQHNSNLESKFNQYIIAKYPKIKIFIYTTNLLAYPLVDLKNLIQNNYSPLLRSFGKYLTTLVLTSSDNSNSLIFEILDNCGCQLKQLGLFNVNNLYLDKLGHSGQSRYIENLGLHYMDHVAFEWLKNMRILKVLRLSFSILPYNDRMHLESLSKMYDIFLEGPCTIQSLFISSNVEFHFQTLCQNFYIKELYLSGHSLPVGSDVYIGKAFPNLCKLYANFNCEQVSTISFPSHHFTLLNLKTNRRRFEVRTLSDDKTRFFNVERHYLRTDYSVFGNGMLPVQEDVLKYKPFITVICGSVKNLILEDVDAYF